MTTTILVGDCRAVLATLPSESVHLTICSPPFWQLRSYLGADHADKALELGSEPAVDCGRGACGACYVCHLVSVFAAVKRVLRPDGSRTGRWGDAT